ncbi:MAG: hypothetical protein SFU25_08640 [Candidatus Caenarcaniphilales bacterium]|nr:hypothetical protein [Candidatus Caenarcaniphilales bacterium]
MTSTVSVISTNKKPKAFLHSKAAEAKRHERKTPNLGDKVFSALPFSMRDILAATSISAGLSQIFQEFNYAFVPKATNALAIRKSWLMVAYEFMLEFPEYLGLYLIPTFFAAIFARSMAGHLKIPNWRLLGEPTWKLEKHLGKEYEVGDSKTLINRELLDKLSFTKFMTFLLAAGTGCAAQVVATAPRAILAKQLFHTDNFYVISGLNVDDSEITGSEESQMAENQAKKNLIASIAYVLLSTPLIAGLTMALGNKIGPQAGKTFTRLSKHFSMDSKFGISKTLTFFNLAIAPYAYTSVAFNQAEKSENIARLIYLALPEVLFLKQIIESILAGIVGFTMGAGNILVSPKTAFEEAKRGERDFFYWSLIDKDHISNLEKVKAMTPEKREKLIGRVHFMERWVVYGMAMLLGFAINWINFLNTKKLDEEEHERYQKQHTNPSDGRFTTRGLTAIGA